MTGGERRLGVSFHACLGGRKVDEVASRGGDPVTLSGVGEDRVVRTGVDRSGPRLACALSDEESFESCFAGLQVGCFHSIA
ncbi:hypothetical protein MRX96_045818 [Rhipicephalus microplus]